MGELRLQSLVKAYGPVKALDSVDLSFKPGRIHALLGENGAGKSTVVRCITGLTRPDCGHMELGGRPYRPASPRDAERLGVACVHQELALLPNLSVGENITLGREPLGRAPWRRILWRRVRERAQAALNRVGARIDVRTPVGELSTAHRQLVAIARALDLGADGASAAVLVLDEPTSSLDAAEAMRLLSVIKGLAKAGLAVVMITHFLDQVEACADDVTVLRDGRVAGSMPMADLDRRRIVSLMVGREIAQAPAGRSRMNATGPAALEAEGLSRRGTVRSASVRLSAGEVVGLAGLLGSGRSEVLRLLFGVDRAHHGRIMRDGRRVRITSPRRAVRLGLALLPEDRATQGIAASLSVRENIELALRARGGVRGRRLRDRCEAIFKSVGIRASPGAPMSALSGGNQQRALLARWLATDPRVLLLDEPTRGIDVAAKADVLALIEAQRAKGMAVCAALSEVEELAAACSRIVVMRDRASVGELGEDSISAGAILNAIARADHE